MIKLVRHVLSTALAVTAFSTALVLGINCKDCSAQCVESSGGESSINIGSQDYDQSAKPVASYLFTNADGTISRVEGREAANHENGAGYILIENYDSSFAYKSFKKVVMELPYYGGIYAGKDYNYVVLGQMNAFESNTIEVIRVIKYSKEWERVSACNISGINTIAPFINGSCRMSEVNGKLYIRTSHRMYKSTDGNNHQANLTLVVDENKMELVDSQSTVSDIKNGYVSHSYNQFIISNANGIFTVDHGDYYPRAVVAGAYKQTAASDGKTETSWLMNNLINIGGTKENNFTGTSVGGFESSNTKLLVTGNIVNQDANADKNKVRNIYLATCSFDMVSSKKVTYLTQYQENSLISVSTPQLVKVNDDMFMLLWEQKKRASVDVNFIRSGVINYIFVNGEGVAKSEVMSVQGSLSDCKPVIYNSKAVWYVTNTSAPVFYTLKITGEKEDALAVGESFKKDGYEYRVTRSKASGYEVELCGFDKNDDTIDQSKVQLPASVEYNGYAFKVTSIKYNAFKNNTKMKTVVLPAYIKAIGKQAFSGCKNIKKIIITGKVTTIKTKAFYKCSKLISITFSGKKIKTIGSKCFTGIYNKAVFYTPKSKLNAYKKLVSKKTGFASKTMRIQVKK